ncbi:MAG TPA: hypothetical protein VE964_16935 [Myxococcales bacterium]|nr:hypothetical protein [Myxococcales bacterium]
MILRVLILAGLLLGFWLGLRRGGIRGREAVTAWLAVAVPLLAWHVAVLQFARGGGFESLWIDVLVGALALPAVLIVRSGARGSRAVAFAWNVLGILDLLVAIALGALTTTGRLPVAVRNSATRSYPLVMIPAFAVPLSLILHALSLRQLSRSGRRSGDSRTVSAGSAVLN